jgi:hypothetical protein
MGIPTKGVRFGTELKFTETSANRVRSAGCGSGFALARPVLFPAKWGAQETLAMDHGVK